MPANHFVQRLFQCSYIKSPTNVNRRRHVIEMIAGVHLVEKPQTLLCIRERKHSLATRPGQRWGVCSKAPAQGRGNRLGQAPDVRPLEQTAQGHINAKGFADARNDLRCQKRMPAQLEEVVIKTDTFQAEDVGPNTC